MNVMLCNTIQYSVQIIPHHIHIATHTFTSCSFVEVSSKRNYILCYDIVRPAMRKGTVGIIYNEFLACIGWKVVLAEYNGSRKRK